MTWLSSPAINISFVHESNNNKPTEKRKIDTQTSKKTFHHAPQSNISSKILWEWCDIYLQRKVFANIYDPISQIVHGVKWSNVVKNRIYFAQTVKSSAYYALWECGYYL